MYVVYHGATDRPAGKYTVREHRVFDGRVEAQAEASDFDDIDAAREHCFQLAVAAGIGRPHRLERNLRDDPAIVELWV